MLSRYAFEFEEKDVSQNPSEFLYNILTLPFQGVLSGYPLVGTGYLRNVGVTGRSWGSSVPQNDSRPLNLVYTQHDVLASNYDFRYQAFSL